MARGLGKQYRVLPSVLSCFRRLFLDGTYQTPPELPGSALARVETPLNQRATRRQRGLQRALEALDVVHRLGGIRWVAVQLTSDSSQSFYHTVDASEFAANFTH